MKLCYVAGKNVRLHAIVRYVCSSLRFIRLVNVLVWLWSDQKSTVAY